MSSKPNIFSIPASAPFAEALAQGVIARLGGDPFALASATIYLPTRRAVRTLADAFARVLGGAALLPDIRPLGDVDEDDFLFDASSDGFTPPPAIAPLRRRLLLAALIRRWDEGREGALTFAQATSLGSSLSRLMDEAETQGVDLSQLDSLSPAAFAEHWKEVTKFLSLVQTAWPRILDAERAINPADYRNQALQALAKRLERAPPAGPVIAAGSTGSIPATATLLGVIGRLPNGMIVLPGVDRTLDEESWRALDPGHAQYGMMHLLKYLDASRSDISDWTPVHDSNRETFLSEALRPAPTTDAWRARAESADPQFIQGLNGVSLLEAAHPAEEAVAIALALRELLEQPHKTAALVTPDRSLARRVSAELQRWDIAIDDSAGRPLSQTPVGAFLCLLAEAADAQFAPVPLLALLKHPLATLGQEPMVFRANVRVLDRLCLRGPRPDPGLAGIAEAIERADPDAKRQPIQDVRVWFERVAHALTPLAAAFAAKTIALADLVPLHVEVAEALAADAEKPGEARLWRGTDGEAGANLIAALLEAAQDIPPFETGSYAPLFRNLVAEKSVRLPYGNHPRLSILGPLEARLQSFDLVVLGGLNEGTWPQAAPIDPWFSRPMRSQLGLEQPERAIGLAAHDFASLASGSRVILTRSRKVEGTPAVASRWLQRIIQLANGVGATLENASHYAGLAARLDDAGPVAPTRAPEPRPPVEARPRALSVTEIETWLRDPYAIYARRVLQLKKLDPLDAPVGALERGTVIHNAMEAFVKRFAGLLPTDAEHELAAIADEMFTRERIPQATLALWRPRFLSAARWFVGLERERRAQILRSHAEVSGTRTFTGPAGDFVLRGRADRIDEKAGGYAVVVDYKTGRPPSARQVQTLVSPQLPLEAAMLAQGGFEGVETLSTDELLYIQLAGGRIAGRAISIPDAEKLTADAVAKLSARIAEFDAADIPYLSRIMPFRADSVGDFDHLARVREWSLSGWAEEDE